MYSGLRPSEVAQLHLEDIKQSSDIWYFDVNDTPPRELRSRYSLRRVPIHSTLIDLGFLVFIDELKKADEKVLFAELWRHSELNPAIASKRFKILLEEVGVVDIGLSGSSFRATAFSVFEQVDYNETLTRAVFGFPTTNLVACFAAPLSLSMLQKTVEVLNFSHLGLNVIAPVKPWVIGCVDRSKMLRKMQQVAPGINITDEDLTNAVMSIPKIIKRRI